MRLFWLLFGLFKKSSLFWCSKGCLFSSFVFWIYRATQISFVFSLGCHLCKFMWNIVVQHAKMTVRPLYNRYIRTFDQLIRLTINRFRTTYTLINKIRIHRDDVQCAPQKPILLTWFAILRNNLRKILQKDLGLRACNN